MQIAPLAEAQSKTSIFDSGNPGFREDFDEKPFEFSHCFTADHPLFQLSRLRKLIENPVTRPGVYFDAGDIRVGQRWDSVPERKQTLEETFDRIDNAGAWILMKRVQHDPDYNQLLGQCLRSAAAKRTPDQSGQEEPGGDHLSYFAASGDFVPHRS